MTETKKRSGYDRFLNILYIVCGAFAFTAYFVYFVKLLIWTEGTLSYVAAILAMLVSGIPLFFKRFWERILPQKVFFVLKNIFAGHVFLHGDVSHFMHLYFYHQQYADPSGGFGQ